MAKYDLVIDPPLMNSAGSLGFASGVRTPVDISLLGAFVTNPISLEPRSPAAQARFREYAGGFLLHTGYPNPGLRSVLRSHASQWKRSKLPVIVSLLVKGIADTARMAQALDGIEGVAGLELSLPPDSGIELAVALVNAAQAGELPVIARLPFERAQNLAAQVIGAGAVAVSLAPPRGAMPGLEHHLITGRLYGPGIFPQSLALVRSLAQDGIQVIGAGGVYSPLDVEAMLAAGACAVQLDSVLWRSHWDAGDRRFFIANS